MLLFRAKIITKVTVSNLLIYAEDEEKARNMARNKIEECVREWISPEHTLNTTSLWAGSKIEITAINSATILKNDWDFVK